MENGVNSISTNLGSSAVCDVPEHKEIVKGSIVLTPNNAVCRVTWVQSDKRFDDGVVRAGVNFLEYSPGYMVYKVSELTLIADGAEKPMFDDITAERLAYERVVYQQELKMIESAPKKSSARKKSAEEILAEELLKKLDPEQLAKLLEDL